MVIKTAMTETTQVFSVQGMQTPSDTWLKENATVVQADEPALYVMDELLGI